MRKGTHCCHTPVTSTGCGHMHNTVVRCVHVRKYVKHHTTTGTCNIGYKVVHTQAPYRTVLCCACMLTHTHTHTRTRTRTRTHARTHAHTHTHTETELYCCSCCSSCGRSYWPYLMSFFAWRSCLSMLCTCTESPFCTYVRTYIHTYIQYGIA